MRHLHRFCVLTQVLTQFLSQWLPKRRFLQVLTKYCTQIDQISSSAASDVLVPADSVIDADPAIELSGEANKKKVADYLKPVASELVLLPVKQVRKQR